MRYMRLPTTRPTPRDLQEPICPRKKCAIWTRWRLVPDARGAYGKWPIDEGKTDEYIPKLQAHLKTLPGGDAMAKKVAGWGVFRDGRNTYYVDRVANKCYRTKPEIVRALKAEASA